MRNWIKNKTGCQAETFHRADEPVALHVITSVGLNARSEQANGYAFIVVREDAFSGSYPVEYLTTEELYKKYGVRVTEGIEPSHDLPSCTNCGCGIDATEDRVCGDCDRGEPILCSCCGSIAVSNEGDMCGVCGRDEDKQHE